MKNITLCADEVLIEQARLLARFQREMLNTAFRNWLLQYTAQGGIACEVDSLIKRLRHGKAGGVARVDTEGLRHADFRGDKW